MEMTPHTRITGYDLARALAIWGMVTVHFWIVLAYRRTDPHWLAWCLNMLDGRAAALFVILAGIGISLLTKSARTGTAGSSDDSANAAGRWTDSGVRPTAALRRLLWRRGLFLLVAGFLNLVIWRGDILRVYGVSLCIAVYLIDVSDRRLLATASFFVLGFVALVVVSDYGAEWNWETF